LLLFALSSLHRRQHLSNNRRRELNSHSALALPAAIISVTTRSTDGCGPQKFGPGLLKGFDFRPDAVTRQNEYPQGH